MKAVNLIPADARRSTGVTTGFSLSPAYGLLGVLAIALALATLYVTSANTVSQRTAELQTLQAEVNTAQAQATSYARFAAFATLAQQRLATVRQIANTRFDWHGALANLSRVVPADTSLGSLQATVAPNQAGGSGASSGSSGLRSYDQGPAFELTGCTATQDDVARLMSRLRLIDGVTRVTLGNSQKTAGTTSGAAVSQGGAAGCGADAPSFDLLVFFAPIPGALTATTPSATTPSTTTPATTATPTSTTTTSTTPTITTSSTGQPVSRTPGGTP